MGSSDNPSNPQNQFEGYSVGRYRRYPCNIRLTHGCWKGVKIKCSYYSAMTPAPIIQIKSMRIMPTASALKIKEYTIRMPRSSVLL